jgi:hypothetical protein
MVLVGVLLLCGLAVVLPESVGYIKGGYDSAFWKLPIDDKLDHVAVHRWEWWLISIGDLIGLVVMTGGMFGLTYLLADGGEPILASVALGVYVVAVLAWVFGLVLQVGSFSAAADQRATSGETPSWIHAFWRVGYVTEASWIVGANLAYACFGVAILRADLVGGWAGWIALVAGILIPVIVIVTRAGFPQLGVLIPALIGIALLIEAL